MKNDTTNGPIGSSSNSDYLTSRAPERSQVSASTSSASTSQDRPLSNTGLSTFDNDIRSLLPGAVNSGLLPKTVHMPKTSISLRSLHLGFDTVQWSYLLGDEQFARLHAWCAASLETTDGEVDIGSLPVGLRRIGGAYCYRVTSSFGLAWHVPRQQHYPLLVIASPQYLLSVPEDKLEYEAWCWTNELLSTPENNDTNLLTLSRVDVALDVLMPDTQFQKFTGYVKNRDERVISRAREVSAYSNGLRDTGFLFGKNEVVLRCYDKTEKATIDNSIEMWAKVWDNPAIDEGMIVARFEYQQRRGFLRSFKTEERPDGIHTLEEYRAAAPMVLLYLTQSWFRLAGKVQGADNYRVTTRFWQAISTAFVCGRWFSEDDIVRVWRDVRRFVSKDHDKMLSMAVGCLQTLAAIMGARDGTGAAWSLPETLVYLEKNITNDKWDEAAFDRLQRIVYNLPK